MKGESLRSFATLIRKLFTVNRSFSALFHLLNWKCKHRPIDLFTGYKTLVFKQSSLIFEAWFHVDELQLPCNKNFPSNGEGGGFRVKLRWRFLCLGHISYKTTDIPCHDIKVSNVELMALKICSTADSEGQISIESWNSMVSSARGNTMTFISFNTIMGLNN